MDNVGLNFQWAFYHIPEDPIKIEKYFISYKLMREKKKKKEFVSSQGDRSRESYFWVSGVLLCRF